MKKVNMAAGFHIAALVLICVVMTRSANQQRLDAAEKAELRLQNNRLARAASEFRLPGFTPWHLYGVTYTSQAMGTGYQILAALCTKENGGQGLDFGIKALPPFVAQQYPAELRQFGAAAVMLNEEAWTFILGDVERRDLFVNQYARRHNRGVDPVQYADDLKRLVDGFMDAGEPALKPKTPARVGHRAAPKKAHHKARRK